ncbi:thiolase protein [Dictyocaulus viviparus]|uniref:Thiolase protein n=1 Tax=Dictyocaulus viviparus TaxID=29172 RepID=A0A0D8XBQ3_DICVI|nr:thiolase protein [Dictyocaulus viviparus]
MCHVLLTPQQFSEVFIVGAKRIAFGTFGGKLKNHSATDLGVVVTTAALQHAGAKAEFVDHIVFGNVVASSKDGIYLTRHIGLKSGIPQNVGALTVNRLCGSGFQSVINAAHLIKLGESHVVVAGGCENMTDIPFVVRNVRFGTALGTKYEFEDMLWESLSDPYAKLSMGQTAEKLGAHYKVSRTDADAFALRSQQLWDKAQKAGYFNAEIVPINVKGKKGEEIFRVSSVYVN